MEEQADMTFEQAIVRLEEIAQILDGGELPLDESLRLFEEGIKLARQCSMQLAEAQGRLEVLMQRPDGTVETEGLEV